jgi:hypothetical protein
VPEGRELPGEDGTLAVLHAMLTTFTEVLDGMDRRLGTMEAAMRSLQADQDQAGELRHALSQLGRVEGIEADLSEIRAALVDHPAATVYDAIAHLTLQVDTLVAQPGPGPAMAMVAAGLSERFEQRTQGLVDLLQEHAEVVPALTEQVERAMQGLVAAVEGRQAGLDALLDTVQAVASAIEGMGARIDEARDRFVAVFRAGEDLHAAMDSLRKAEEAIRATAQMIEDQGMAGLTAVVREESELLAQRISAISVSLDSVQALLAGHVQDSAHSLGRKASEAGRRLVADLGLAGRSRDTVAKSAPEPAPARNPRPKR